jgi:hypothetical protein
MTVAQNQVKNASNRRVTNTRQRSGQNPSAQIADNRHETVEKRDLMDGIHDSPRMLAQRRQIEGYLQSDFSTLDTAQLKEEPAHKPNSTGLPDNLKTGIEALSGISMDNVRIHYNSPQPAQLNALAYAQGTNIHIAPGQEQHLPHEAWHVVQQAQGRVQPTMQMKDGVPINGDEGLEREADEMGMKAMYIDHLAIPSRLSKVDSGTQGRPALFQPQGVVQRIPYTSKIKGKLYTSYHEVEEDYLKEFVEWCVSEKQAIDISRNFTFNIWNDSIRPLSPENNKNQTFKLQNKEEIQNAIETFKVKERNRETREAAAAAASIVNYDDAEREYTPPGEPLQQALSECGINLARIEKVHKFTAQELLNEDLKYEKARWELSQNVGKLTEEARKLRNTAQKEANNNIKKIIDNYKPLEADFKKEEDKKAEIAGTIVAVENLQPQAFRNNALCMELWVLAKKWAGYSGKYELENGYNEEQLRAAWQAWIDFQNAVANVENFQTHRIGNGTAQDKSTRDDIKTRHHTFQMNFSVTWKGIEQMIHVGLAGTENKNYTG